MPYDRRDPVVTLQRCVYENYDILESAMIRAVDICWPELSNHR